MEINKDCQTAFEQLGDSSKFDNNTFKTLVDLTIQIILKKESTDQLKSNFIQL